ncbi:hypothetical protein OHB01_32670 [Microbispora hainanensis]|jgi:hypothetical protein|uniref:Uncharacterized protein n=1 Tax=Microbispora hainanensis TaxID=568844 RepID=A0ABZ1SXC0_9ACTN|nr:MULTISPECIES: hypothetical protein [Microbispora]
MSSHRATVDVVVLTMNDRPEGGHGQRRPMSWATVVRLTLAGRPPII